MGRELELLVQSMICGALLVLVYDGIRIFRIIGKRVKSLDTAVDILFYRFLLGYLMLWIVCPKRFRPEKLSHELYFLAAGASGVTVYYLLENMALTYSLTSNVSIIVSIAPFLTAVMAHLVLKDEKMKKSFVWGFVVAILGVALVTFNGRAVLKLNPIGDTLAVGAAVVWAVYAIVIRRWGRISIL